MTGTWTWTFDRAIGIALTSKWIYGLWAYGQWTANSDYPLRQPTELELDPGGRH